MSASKHITSMKKRVQLEFAHMVKQAF